MCRERNCAPFRAATCVSGLVLEVHVQSQTANATGAGGHGEDGGGKDGWEEGEDARETEPTPAYQVVGRSGQVLADPATQYSDKNEGIKLEENEMF